MARQTRTDREHEAAAGRRVNRELNHKDSDRLSYHAKQAAHHISAMHKEAKKGHPKKQTATDRKHESEGMKRARRK